MICTAWYQWLLTNWEQTKISFPFTKLMSDWSYKKKPPLCFHTLFRFVSPYECNAISSSVFFLTLIQFNGMKSRHPFHTQIRPITTTSVSIRQNNFPSKEFNSYYASSTFSSVSFTISSYLLHATLTPHEIHINRTDKAPFSSNSLGFCVKH